MGMTLIPQLRIYNHLKRQGGKVEKQASLYKKYPKLFRQKDWSMKKSLMCFGLECGQGWFSLISMMCQAIHNHLKNHKGLKCEFVQIKEKYGTLSVYYDGGDDYIAGIVLMAEYMSSVICEKCGSPGKIRPSGWLRCECEKCYKERINANNHTKN